MLIREIYEIRQLNWLNYNEQEQEALNEKFKILKNDVENAISMVTESNELERIIDFEKEQFFMPIDTMFKVHQKRIELSPKQLQLYEQFARYLLWYGPDWEIEATQILKYVEIKDFNQAHHISKGITY